MSCFTFCGVFVVLFHNDHKYGLLLTHHRLVNKRLSDQQSQASRYILLSACGILNEKRGQG